MLTEFVDGDHHARFKDALRDIGLKHLAVSLKASRQNQVLMAARESLADDGGLPLPGHTEAATVERRAKLIQSRSARTIETRPPRAASVMNVSLDAVSGSGTSWIPRHGSIVGNGYFITL